MPFLDRDRAPLALVFAIELASCASSKDPACRTSGSPAAYPTAAYVGLFDDSGEAICNPSVVTASQGGGPEFGLTRLPFAQGELRPDGRLGLRPGGPCNLYFSSGPQVANAGLRSCGAPLSWRVRSDGCEDADGSLSWNDNYEEGSLSRNFNVVVRLRCSPGVGDGGGAPANAPVGADAPDASAIRR